MSDDKNKEDGSEKEKPTGTLDPDVLKALAEDTKKAQDAASGAQKHSDLNRNLILAGFWVVAIGFIAILLTAGAMFQSYIAARTNTFQNLVDKISEQSVKLDLLYQDTRELKNKQSNCLQQTQPDTPISPKTK